MPVALQLYHGSGQISNGFKILSPLGWQRLEGFRQEQKCISQLWTKKWFLCVLAKSQLSISISSGKMKLTDL